MQRKFSIDSQKIRILLVLTKDLVLLRRAKRYFLLNFGIIVSQNLDPQQGAIVRYACLLPLVPMLFKEKTNFSV